MYDYTFALVRIGHHRWSTRTCLVLGGRGKEEKEDRARSLEMGSCFDYLIRIIISNENASFAFFNVIVIIIIFW